MEEPRKRRRVLPVAAPPSHESVEFRPGNIIRLQVWNFTTYTHGDFRLTPSLNMIIGPNGTGKLTFVAAVCLGLGGKVDLIKRKSMDTMIKSGHKESTIEITLKNHPGQPDCVIRRTFALRLNRSNWLINGATSDVVAVRDLVLSFNIQLDNLCHFLPQERVAEFASLLPEKLLLETERTLGDSSLLKKHQLLIELDEQRLDATAQAASVAELVSSLQADVSKFEVEAQKYQEYEEKALAVRHHRKLLPYARLQDLKERLKTLKHIRDAAKKELMDFSRKREPLALQVETAKTAAAEHGATLIEITENHRSLATQEATAAEKASEVTSELATARSELDSVRSRTETHKAELNATLEERKNLRIRLDRLPEVDEDSLTKLSDERKLCFSEKARLDEEHDALKFELNALKRDIIGQEQRYKDERRKLDVNDRLEVLTSTNTRYRRELLENAYKAHVHLRAQKLPFHEAPVISCRVTNPVYAKYFEKVIDNNSLFALFFESESQYQAVLTSLPREVNVPMRVVPRTSLQQPMSSEKLRLLGFDGYLSEFLTGPDAVLQGLNHRSFLHCIPVSHKSVDQNVLNKLLQPGANGKLPFLRFVVENNLFIVGRSRYGSRQTFYLTENIPGAQLMGAEGLSEEVKEDIRHRLSLLKAKIADMIKHREDLEVRLSEKATLIASVAAKLSDLDREVKELRRNRDARSKLQDTLRHTEARIEQLTKATTEDHSAAIAAAEDLILAKYTQFAKQMEIVASFTQKMAELTVQARKSELRKQQLENKTLTLELLLREFDEKKQELQTKYAEAKARYDEYKKGDAATEIRSQSFTAEEREAVRLLAETYLSQNQLSEQFVTGKIEQLEDDMLVLASADRGSLEVLKNKKADLELAERQLPELERKRDNLTERITKVALPWEEELQGMVDLISAAFQKRFVTVASDGQVELAKLERYKDWKLEILVKFRENSELKVLDHQSQSGGERAVLTIFFIMSLQGLTTAPIRIVDEINQGMDPKNEKMAHKYLVHTACRKSTAQYFLVTPKLLTGLYYHPGMSIHCIFAGPFIDKLGNLLAMAA